MPSGTQITDGWGATVTQTGQQASAKAPTWAPDLAGGASASIGIQATGASTGARRLRRRRDRLHHLTRHRRKRRSTLDEE